LQSLILFRLKNQFSKNGIMIIALCLILTCLSAFCQSPETSIIIVGDIMFGSEIAQLIDSEGSSLVPFSGVLPILNDADITFGTFEGVISTRGEPIPGKSVTFRSKPSAARSFANSGFDVVSLATSHIMDYGDDGFLDTLDTLTWYGVKYVGAGVNLQEARKAIVLPAKDAKVGFLAYYRGNQFDKLFFASENKIGPALPVFAELEQDVLKAKNQADVVIVAMNWGPRIDSDAIISRQKLYAQKLIDSGADFVVGQRVNVLQGVEIYKGKPIFYSLGDFIYGTYANRSPYGYILRLIISDKKLTRVEIIPVSISDATTGSYLPNVLHGESANDALINLQKLSEEFGTEFQIENDIGIIKLD
jgi:poly-gamma-glutamate capsule biosynthesis protein CapA/YwtB (metallophosphatase superfamily)